MIRIMEPPVSLASPGSPAVPGLHQPPRRPHAWAWGLAVSQVLAVAAWWRWGWEAGVPLLLASHVAFLWGTFRPASALFGPVLARLPTREPVVWLTIDDGPSDDTPAILDALDAHGAKATFFVVASRARARPDLVREIVRRGHGIGNHSDSHPTARFWALGPRAMRREIETAQASLAEIAGVAPVWFRAVVGMANPFVAASLQRLGLARVAWSARGFDGAVSDPARVLRRVERQLSPGAIVLAHEGASHGHNLETLALLLQRFDALGYRCVLPAVQFDDVRPVPVATRLAE
jgi:peptidoglycan/xylan/chitin deacetylase (PgdA/CDA1 family)